MNIILGSSTGIGKSLYEVYKNKNLEVLGIDKLESRSTDYVYDFGKIENIKELIEQFDDYEISSITYCIAEQEKGKDIQTIFNTNVLTFLSFLKSLNDDLNNVSICALSSVHAVSSNYENLYYASSKAALETGMRTFATKKSNNSFYCLRLGATNTEQLFENVDDVKKITDILPSGKLFKKEEVAKLIYTLNSEHKNLLNGSVIQIDNAVLSMLRTD